MTIESQCDQVTDTRTTRTSWPWRTRGSTRGTRGERERWSSWQDWCPGSARSRGRTRYMLLICTASIKIGLDSTLVRSCKWRHVCMCSFSILSAKWKHNYLRGNKHEMQLNLDCSYAANNLISDLSKYPKRCCNWLNKKFLMLRLWTTSFL